MNFDYTAPDLVTPILNKMQEGQYDAARALLKEITDEQKRQAVQYTLATQHQIYL